jgi:hypothetical protein
MKDYGMEREASYMGAASRGGVQGASMLAPLGPLAMILGAAGGAGLGALQNYFDRDAIGKQQADGVRDAAGNLAKTREEMDRVAEHTDNFQKLLQTLGDTEADAASRAKLLADEIEKRARGESDAKERMKAAEAAMKSFAATIDGPMTKAQEKYLAKLDEEWKNAARDLATNRAERKNLEGQKIEKDKPSYDQNGTENEKLASIAQGLEKAGIGFAALGANKAADFFAAGGTYGGNDYVQGGENDASTWVERDEAESGMADAVQSVAALGESFSSIGDAVASIEESVARYSGDKTTEAVEDGNDIAEKSLAVLESIERNTGGAPTAVFA